jgi:OPA family glycerol-3-phosphate transporter-like MFS transporter
VHAKEKEEPASSVRMELSVLFLIGAVIVAIVLQGFLRDGVTNWTPSYVSDIFRVDSSAAILSGVILPVFSIVCFQLADVIHRKLLKNEMVCAMAFFLTGAVAAVVLAVTDGQNMIVSLSGLALLVGSMHGVNLMLISMVPHYFEKFGKVSLVSGILNAGTYIGSALSAYGTAVYTENFGWQSTIFLWAAVAASGAAVCICLKRKWHKFCHNG